MLRFFFEKLHAKTSLSACDIDAFQKIEARERQVPAGAPILLEGESMEVVPLLARGAACGYKTTASGRRQITSFIVPGDICDLRCVPGQAPDFSVESLAASTVVEFAIEDMCRLAHQHPRISQALWCAKLIDEAMLRAWLLGIGQKDADERMAHLLCEMFFRLNRVGLVNGSRFTLPFSQAQMADALGISGVHASRTIQGLKQKKLIALNRRSINILDLDALMELSEFDPAYLSTLGLQDAARPPRRQAEIRP